MLADTPLEKVDIGTSSETLETLVDAIETLGKSEDEKVQVESPTEYLITREINVEEESSKEITLKEEVPVDTISTDETVHRENIKREKSPVLFDFKNESDTDPLSNNNSLEESHAKVDTLAEKEKVEQKSIPGEEERLEMPLKDAEANVTPISENVPADGSTMGSLLTEDITVVAEPYTREALPEEPSVEISVATQSITADTEALYEEPANVLIKPCVEVTTETLPDDDDIYLTPVDILDKAGPFTKEESGIYLVEKGVDEPTNEDEEYLYEEIDGYLATPTYCKCFTLVLLTNRHIVSALH